jgi:hypothetical protein
VAKDGDPRTEPEPHEAEPSEEAEDRAAILRRRAMFIASAIAGLGMAASCSEPQPCLNIAIPEEPHPDAGAEAADAAADAEPEPCLSVAVPMEDPDAGAGDAGADAATDAGSRSSKDAGADGGVPKPRPRPCLKKAPPRPCLNMILDDD